MLNSITTLLMSAIYIFNPSTGKYLSFNNDGTPILSSVPVSTELTEIEETSKTGRYNLNDMADAWVIKTYDVKSETYTIGYNVYEANATTFLYATTKESGDIAFTYAEPATEFKYGQWQISSTDFEHDNIVLYENQTYSKPNFLHELATIELHRKLYAKEWNTLCLPFPISDEMVKEIWGEDTKVAEFIGLNGNHLVFRNGATIKAGVPCLLNPEKTAENDIYTFEDIQTATWDSSDGSNTAYTKDNMQFTGSYSPRTVPSRAYVFGDGDKMYHLTSAMETNGFRAYFWDVNVGTATARKLTWGIDETPTNIEFVPNSDKHTSKDIYMPNGKLAKKKATTTQGLRPGVYIMHGMKVIVK